MKTGLYKIKVRCQVEELENGGSVMLLGNGGMVVAEVHPVKIKGAPKKEEPTVNVQPMDVVRSVKSICRIMDCRDCPLLEWCQELPPDGKPINWIIPKKLEG